MLNVACVTQEFMYMYVCAWIAYKSIKIRNSRTCNYVHYIILKYGKYIGKLLSYKVLSQFYNFSHNYVHMCMYVLCNAYNNRRATYIFKNLKQPVTTVRYFNSTNLWWNELWP